MVDIPSLCQNSVDANLTLNFSTCGVVLEKQCLISCV